MSVLAVGLIGLTSVMVVGELIGGLTSFLLELIEQFGVTSFILVVRLVE